MPKKEDGTCVYAHPQGAKGIGKSTGKKGGVTANNKDLVRLHHELAKAVQAAAKALHHHAARQ